MSGDGRWQGRPVQAEEWAGGRGPDHWGHGVGGGAADHSLPDLLLNGEVAA